MDGNINRGEISLPLHIAMGGITHLGKRITPTPCLSLRGIILLDDENLFHIRSFHASRRQEPNLDGR